MNLVWASPVALVVKNLLANEGDARDAGLLPELGRSLRVGNDTSLQCSCLENSWSEEPGGLHSSPWGHKELDPTELLNTQQHMNLI